MIEARPAMDPRDLARTALLETWRRDGAEAWIEATGGSMLPLIRPGDRLLVGFGAQGARRGDVILFRHRDLVVAHRVVGVRGGRLLAKGDGEPFATEDVEPAALLGIVRVIERGSGRQTRRGLGGRSGALTARMSRFAGALTRASARRSSLVTNLPIAGAALAARSALSLWALFLASSGKVESLGKGGD
jgi:peptidase S24-like protein